jgi:hypothetical protein
VLTAPARSFQYWNTEQHQWSVLGGNKLIHVGASSRDLRLQADLLYSPRQ